MGTINVNLRKKSEESYKIIVEPGLFSKLPNKLKRLKTGTKLAIISDTNVGKLYGSKLIKAVRKNGTPADLFTFKGGDKQKTLPTAEKLIGQMLKKGYNRNDAVIALGGGVVGDLAGLVASVYMRGVPLVHIPTTLLAMVDSSIGGKTGVNTAAGKNLIGTFYQPQAVFIDPKLLKTLPETEFRNGLSETMKYGAIANKKMFEELEENGIKKSSSQILNKLIEQCCRIKASIVEKDEKESALRMVLNYGHTFGHAIEKLSNYKVTHGEAIAVGMRLINNICLNKQLLTEKDCSRINNLITKLRLEPKNLSLLRKSGSAQLLWKTVKNDKKVKNGIPTFIVVPRIGQAKTTQTITITDLKKVLKQNDRS